MARSSNIDLGFRDDAVVRQEGQSISIGGFRAERVAVGGDVAYEYRSVGARPYIAIHDIELRGGEISLDDGAPAPVSDLLGRITFAPGGCPLSGWASTHNRLNSFTSITFDEGALAQELDASDSAALERPIIHFRDPRLETTLWKVDAALRSATTIDALYFETLLNTAIIELGLHAKGIPSQIVGAGRLSANMERRLKEFVLQNLARNISLSDLAGVARLSRFHFARSFKATFGVSPLEYVHRSRAETAMHLLATTKLPIAEIAHRVGFPNPDRMTTMLKKLTQLTPRQFRQASQ